MMKPGRNGKLYMQAHGPATPTWWSVTPLTFLITITYIHTYIIVTVIVENIPPT